MTAEVALDDTRRAYDAWHEKGWREDEGATLMSWHRNVARLLTIEPGEHVLEIGCGRGEFAGWLARTFPDSSITGVDFSEGAIAIARDRPDNDCANLAFQVADATALEFADASFDVIVTCECIEHVPEPHRMAGEMARVLKPGGRFFLTTENYLNGMALMWAKALVTGVPIDTGSGTQPHENFFLYWRVIGMLEKAGLDVTHYESDHFQWLMLPRVNPSRLCTLDFRNRFLKRFFRPFGRHFTFAGVRAA